MKLSIFLQGASLAALVATSATSATPAGAQTAKPAAGGVKDVPTPVHPGQIAQSQAEAVKLSDAFVSVAEKVVDSVVQIDVTSRDENAEQVTRWLGGRGDSPVARGTGSGVVFTADGAILTNDHVIEDALTIAVHLHDGRVLPAKLLGRDPDTDLAVVKVDATGLVPAKFADSDVARVGQWVVAIGSPLGLGYSVTAGVLSAKGRSGFAMNAIEDFLQTDASINPGNSGGPLCDLDGKVVGINSMIAAAKGGGIGFAIPSNMARRAAEQIQKTGRVQRATVGVIAQDLTPELATAFNLDARAGALVDQVLPDGPAAKANVRPGDVIAMVGGHTVHDRTDLMREILAHDVGSTLALEIIRAGKHYRADATLAARQDAVPPPVPAQMAGAPHVGLGMSVRNIGPEDAAAYGLPARAYSVITNVVPGSAADRGSLKSGDIIVHADGTENPTSDQVAKLAEDGQLLVRVHRRNRGQFYAALKK